MAEKKAKKKSTPVITRLVLINLHISHDTGRRAMKNISKKIATDNDADVKMINSSIKLIPPDKVKLFTTALSRARTYYIDHSLPWEDGNWRVVPVSKFQAFKDDLEKLISEAKDAFEKCYITDYDKLKADAEKKRGKLSVDFPTKDELQKGFSIEYNVGAVASADDIRIVGIDSAMRKKISQETEDRYNSMINRGLTELTDGLSNSLSELSERVGDDDQKGKKYTKFLENLKKMTETVKDLNVTKNSTLDSTCQKIQEEISCWSPEAIKSDQKVRDHIKSAAGSVQDELSTIKMSEDDD